MIGAIITVILFAAMIIITVYLLLVSRYKISVVIREVVGDRSYIKFDKAREVKDENDILWWKLLKSKDKIPVPPPDVIDVTGKGKRMVEFYRTSDRVYIPIKADFNYDDFLQKFEHQFQPFPTEQRVLLVNEYAKSKAYQKKRLSDILNIVAPSMAIVLILALFLIFFKDAVQPMIDAGHVAQKLNEQTVQALTLVKDILQNTTTVTLPTNIPP